MVGEKYIVATLDNPLQIVLRNILNPCGYIFMDTCNDGVSLLRLVRSYMPDFIVVDMSMQTAEFRNALEIIDSEMLCACIVLGEHKAWGIEDFIMKSNTASFCMKPIHQELLLHTVELAIISFKRISVINKKLTEMTENFETRKAVERAKWILMERDGLSEKHAYEKIRKKSMNERMTMKEISEAIIFTYEIINKKFDN